MNKCDVCSDDSPVYCAGCGRQLTAEREKVRKLRYYLGEAITEIDDQQPCGDHPAWCTVHQEKPWRCENKRKFIDGAKQALKETE